MSCIFTTQNARSFYFAYGMLTKSLKSQQGGEIISKPSEHHVANNHRTKGELLLEGPG